MKTTKDVLTKDEATVVNALQKSGLTTAGLCCKTHLSRREVDCACDSLVAKGKLNRTTLKIGIFAFALIPVS